MKKRFFTFLLLSLCAVMGVQALGTYFIPKPMTLPSNYKVYFGVTSLQNTSTEDYNDAPYAGAMTIAIDDHFNIIATMPNDADGLCAGGVRIDAKLCNAASLYPYSNLTASIGLYLGLGNYYIHTIYQDGDAFNYGLKTAFFKNCYSLNGAHIEAKVNGIPTNYFIPATMSPNATGDGTYHDEMHPDDWQSTDRAWNELISHVSIGQDPSSSIFLKFAKGSYIKNGNEQVVISEDNDFNFSLSTNFTFDGPTNYTYTIYDEADESKTTPLATAGVRSEYYLSNGSVNSNLENKTDILLKAGSQIGIQGLVLTLKHDCHITSTNYWLNMKGAIAYGSDDSPISEDTGFFTYVMENIMNADGLAPIANFLFGFDGIIGSLDNGGDANGYTKDGTSYNNIKLNVEFTEDANAQAPVVAEKETTIKVNGNDESVTVSDGSATVSNAPAVSAVINNTAMTDMLESETGIQKATTDNAVVAALQAQTTDQATKNAITAETTSRYVDITPVSATTTTTGEGDDAKTIVTSFIFNVKPMAKTTVTDASNNAITAVIPNNAITSPITFRLGVDANVTAEAVNVFHIADGSNMHDPIGAIVVSTDAEGNKYVEISASSFSQYGYEVQDNLSADATGYVYDGSFIPEKNQTLTQFKAYSNNHPNAIMVTDNAVSNEKNVIYKPAQSSSAPARKATANNGVTTSYVCDDFQLADDHNFYTPVEFTATSAEYSRSMSSVWGTICLPYAVESDANIQYYKLQRVTDGIMVFEPVNEIAAATPAVFKRLGTATVTTDNALVSMDGDMTDVSADSSWTLVGTYTAKNMATQSTDNAKKYYIAKNSFWKFSQNTNAEIEMSPFRAYFEYTGTESQAPARFSIAVVNNAGAVTSLGSIDAEGNIQMDKYFQNGKLFVRKNGHIFDAQGKLVK